MMLPNEAAFSVSGTGSGFRACAICSPWHELLDAIAERTGLNNIRNTFFSRFYFRLAKESSATDTSAATSQDNASKNGIAFILFGLLWCICASIALLFFAVGWASKGLDADMDRIQSAKQVRDE